MSTTKTATKVAQKVQPKAAAKRVTKTKAAAKPVYVYDFWSTNAAKCLRNWLDLGYITVTVGGRIEWSYTDDSPCYTSAEGRYPYRLWATPEERFAPVLGCTPMEVPWFWDMTQDRHAAGLSQL